MSVPGLKELLQDTIEKLRSERVGFALAGGLVASLYREENRLTEDIDLLFLSDSAESDAVRLLDVLGFKSNLVKLHHLKRIPMMNKKRAPALIVVGRNPDRPYGVDFILPSMPWFEKALARAQNNMLDFGFGLIPCMTVEDIILAKAFAARRKDEDDLISIFSAGHELDLIYLSSEMKRLDFKFGKEVLKEVPKELRKVLKKRRPAGA